MFSTCLPLNYNLEPARPWGVAEVTEMTQAASGNSMSSIGYTLFLASIYFLAGWMLLKKPKTVASLLVRQWPLLFLMLFVAASAIWSYHPEKVVSNIAHNSGVLFLALAAALRYRHDPWLLARHLGYILGLNLILQLAAVILIPTYAIDWQGRWHGLAIHPNTFGAFVFTVLWVNAAVLICRKSDKNYIHFAFCVLACIALIGADSVTSMMISMIAIGLIYLLKTLGRMGAGRNFYIGALGLGVLSILFAVMAGSTFDLGGLFGIFGRDSNLTGRTSIWEDAIAAISIHPVLGWSFDDHAYLIRSKGMPYTSYHNGFLDLAVNGGAIAIVLFLMLLGTWAIGFTKSFLIGRQIAPLTVSFVIAYLVHNLTEASLVSPRDQLWVIFLVLLFLSACRKIPTDTGEHRQEERLSAPQLRIGPIANLG